MKMLQGKDKYLSIIIILILFLISNGHGVSLFSMLFKVIMYLVFAKVIIKLSSIVQSMIIDVRGMFKV